MSKPTARQEEKRKRRGEIIHAAETAFSVRSYEAVTMGGLAESLGLAKGTMYLYFPSKESLFLAVLQQSLDAWFKKINDHLLEFDAITAEHLSRLITSTLSTYPIVPRLLVMLHTVLEYNVAPDEVREFRRVFLKHAQVTASQFSRLLSISVAEAIQLLVKVQGLIICFWQMANVSPVADEVLKEEEFSLLRVDFSSLLAQTLQEIIHGKKFLKHSVQN